MTGAIERWNDNGSRSWVVNERERTSKPERLKTLDRQNPHLPAPCESVLPATADALLEAASTAADARSFSS